LEVTHEEGTWTGSATSTFGNGEALTHAELTGSGAHDGLVYEFASNFTDEDDGEGTAVRTGTISTAP
jgi:hypothetical protein